MTTASHSLAYRAARESAGLLPRAHGLIVVSGQDRASYLQGLFTNDIAGLTAGHGCYTAYLTAQGRMISDLYAYELGDVLLLALPQATKDTVLAKLDQFIFSEDVQLGDVTGTFASMAVLGPAAAQVLSAATGLASADLAALPGHGNLRRDVLGQPAIVLRITDAGVSGFDLLVPAEAAASVADALRAAGAVDVDAGTAEVLRIEAGVPRFGTDMDDETIPLEAGIESRAISFSKGCYVGQEIIIRVLHRGHGRVAKKLVGLVFAESIDVPVAGTTLHTDDKEVGRVTSSAWSPALGRAIALGYVKREVADAAAPVTTASGAAAALVPLPFVPAS